MSKDQVKYITLLVRGSINVLCQTVFCKAFEEVCLLIGGCAAFIDPINTWKVEVAEQDEGVR
jgi:hypothetical protein